MPSSDTTDRNQPAEQPAGAAMQAGAAHALVPLSVDECLILLRRQIPKIGRIAVVENGQPIVLPVNYAYDRGTIVVRTDHGAKLTAALMNQPVAFEVDEIDVLWQEGWSVLVKGRLEEITEPQELESAMRLPLTPWAPGSRSRYVRVVPHAITGRRLA